MGSSRMLGEGWRALLGRLRRRLAQRRWRSARRLAVSGPLWAGLALGFVLVVALGTVGFTRYQQGAVGLDSLATRVYKSLQLFALESGAVDGSLPWQLEVARFAAPLLAAFAIVQTLAAVFRAQVESLRLRLVRDHVVVAGLGRKGRFLAQELLRRGDRVVVIEADDSNAELDTLRSVGGLVVIGDSRTADTLRRAKIERASHLVALCGDDGTNTETVAAAREVVGDQCSGVLQCVAQLSDPDLCLLLSSEELERYGQARVRMDFVDVYAAGAQALLRAHPAWDEGAGTEPTVMLVGTGPTARHLLPVLARAWAAGDHPASVDPLSVTVTGLDAMSLSLLHERHPELARFASVRVAEDSEAALSRARPTVVYVCPDDDALATTTALRRRGLLAGQPCRIVVVLEQWSGVGRLLQGAPNAPHALELATFALFEETCRPEVLLTGTTELLAQALHRSYLEMHADAPGRGADPALRPWKDLPEALRESNRDQAAHVAVKLSVVGRAVGPLVDWDTAHGAFSDAEVEVMARLEHDRWLTERRRAGWRPGPRDQARRTSPYLVPWEELSEAVRDSDRMFVRQLPHLLASIGLQAHQPGVSGPPANHVDPAAAGSGPSPPTGPPP
jgi:voltage-gated potassium channel Kch